MTQDPFDHLGFLLSSGNRIKILRELEASPRRKATLSRECDISRTTVHRAIESMKELGWVTQVDREYRLTFVGTALIDSYESFEQEFATVLEKRSFFENFESEIDIPTEVLSDLRVTVSSSEDPHATMQVFRNAAESDTDRFVGILPIISPGYIEIAETMFESGTEMELIVDQGALGPMQSNYQNDSEKALNSEHFSLYIYPGELQIALALFDQDHAMVTAFDGNGQLHGGLDGSSEAVINWTEEVFESVREQSQQITQPP